MYVCMYAESGKVDPQLFKTGENVDEYPTPSDPRMNLKSPSKWQVGCWCPVARERARRVL